MSKSPEIDCNHDNQGKHWYTEDGIFCRCVDCGQLLKITNDETVEVEDE